MSQSSTLYIDLVDNYLENKDWRVKENANMSFSLQGLRNYIVNEITKTYWSQKIYSKEITQSHDSGDFHIHDMGELSPYCVGWDLYDLLVQGFGGVPGKIESSPAKHFRSALGQMVNFLYTLQGETAGAQAFSSFDTLLAPFIRYDKLTYKEVKQAMQEFIYNMNVPTRVGFQTPFTNITMDLTVSPNYANQAVIIGGKAQSETYADFQPEMDLINKAFLEVMTEGDAKGRVFTFPIPTYNITKDFDWDNKTIELLWEATAKYGLPYFSNFINSDMDPADARSMCCRLRLNTKELAVKGGGLFGSHPLTGSIGVVTINMPRIGYVSKSKEEFLQRLERLMNLAKESLEIKRKVVEEYTEFGMYPYSKVYLGKIKQRFNQYWKNHFSTIGLVGMNEAIVNFLGTTIATSEGKEFAEEIMDFMKNKMIEFQQETGNNYNLEATPAESTAYRFARLDQKQFGANIVFANDLAVMNEHAEPFYTNSTHLPVNHTDDPFEVLELQDELQTKYTGGTVIHLFVGEKIHNFEGVKQFVKTVCQKYRLPYFTITPTFSICPSHGYIAGEHHQCPECQVECEVYSRIVGYLRPVKQWNNGKKEEYGMRETYKIEDKIEIKNIV